MKQITSLSVLTAITGLCLGISFSAKAQNWLLAGNAPVAGNFVGTTNAIPLQLKTTFATTPQPINFFTGNVQRATILGNGNFGIGTAGPAYKLESKGNIVNSNPSMGWIGLTGDLPGYAADVYPTLKTNYANLYFSTGGNYTGYIGNGGILGLRTTGGSVNVQLNASGNSFLSGGNLGIGTKTPYSKLQVGTGITKVSTGDCYAVALGYGAAYIGFNASRQASNSWISETDGYSQSGGFVMFSRLEGDLNFAPINSTGNANQTYDDASVYSRVALKIDRNGNVGIGTKNNSMPDWVTYKLAVNGNIICEQVKVINDVPSSDFVFNKDYKLMDIMQTEAYIKEHKHLPEIPSAEEFKKNGYTVGQMDDLLLRKIEQLTLYVIELKKENDNLKNENSEIKSRMSAIENTNKSKN